MKPKLLAMWVEMARSVARLSTCDRTQVGALLLSVDGERLLSFGYNGGPRGLANQPEADEEGSSFWIHAEANALVKPRGLETFLLLCTHTPCVRCAGLIINSGVKRVLCLGRYREPAGELLIHSAGVPLLVDGCEPSDPDFSEVARWFT